MIDPSDETGGFNLVEIERFEDLTPDDDEQNQEDRIFYKLPPLVWIVAVGILAFTGLMIAYNGVGGHYGYTG